MIDSIHGGVFDVAKEHVLSEIRKAHFSKCHFANYIRDSEQSCESHFKSLARCSAYMEFWKDVETHLDTAIEQNNEDNFMDSIESELKGKQEVLLLNAARRNANDFDRGLYDTMRNFLANDFHLMKIKVKNANPSPWKIKSIEFTL